MVDKDLGLTIDDMLDALAAYVEPDPIPEGWYTVKEIAEHKGVKCQRVTQMMQKRLKQGLVERKEFDGRVYYKVKE